MSGTFEYSRQIPTICDTSPRQTHDEKDQTCNKQDEPDEILTFELFLFGSILVQKLKGRRMI